MQPYDLRVEGKASPLGVGTATPHFDFKLSPPPRGIAQASYQIQVGSTGTADLWDSGAVASAQRLQIPYAGSALASRQLCSVRARVTDSAGVVSPWATSTFGVGLLNASDWGATAYVGFLTGPDPGVSMPSPIVRKDFALAKPIARAMLYSTALGFYVVSINGQRVGFDVESPGWTEWTVRRQYQAYDVTALLNASGNNAVAMLLGDGRFAGTIGFLNRGLYSAIGVRPYGALLLHVDYTDGTSSTVVTDSTWVATSAGVLSSDLYAGETLDARLDFCFSDPHLSTAGWAAVDTAIPFAPALMSPEVNDPVKLHGEYPFRGQSITPDGKYLLDYGQARSSVLQVNAPLPSGSQLSIQVGEDVTTAGDLYTGNLNGSLQTDTLTSSGNPGERLRTHFTAKGGRYAKVTGWPLGRAPLPHEVCQVSVHADTPIVGRFTCSNSNLSRLWQNSIQSQLSNIKAVVSDSNQRLEQLPWVGDVGCDAGALPYCIDARNVLAKLSLDLYDGFVGGGYGETAPFAPFEGRGGSGWADMGVVIPWHLLKVYGNKSIPSQVYPGISAYIAGSQFTNRYGDFQGDPAVSGVPQSDPLVFQACYSALGLKRAIDIATALGNTADVATATTKLNAYLATIAGYIQSDGTITSNPSTYFPSECSQVLPLAFGLVPAGQVALVFAKLVALIGQYPNGFQCGAVALAHFLPVLVANGRQDLAYALMTSTAGDPLNFDADLALGATTLGESFNPITRWRSGIEPGRSANHHWRSSICRWLAEDVAGLAIDYTQPAGTQLVAAPRPGGAIPWVDFEWQSPAGPAESHWRWGGSAGTQFDWYVAVPATTLASIPWDGTTAITESGTGSTYPLATAPGVSNLGTGTGARTCTLAPGSYHFTSKV